MHILPFTALSPKDPKLFDFSDPDLDPPFYTPGFKTLKYDHIWETTQKKLRDNIVENVYEFVANI